MPCIPRTHDITILYPMGTVTMHVGYILKRKERRAYLTYYGSIKSQLSNVYWTLGWNRDWGVWSNLHSMDYWQDRLVLATSSVVFELGCPELDKQSTSYDRWLIACSWHQHMISWINCKCVTHVVQYCTFLWLFQLLNVATWLHALLHVISSSCQL